MLEGTTKSGFEYSIESDALDDYEFLELLVDLDKSNLGQLPKAIKMLLGDKQHDRLKEHCRENGRVKMTRLFAEFNEIMVGAGKNS